MVVVGADAETGAGVRTRVDDLRKRVAARVRATAIS